MPNKLIFRHFLASTGQILCFILKIHLEGLAINNEWIMKHLLLLITHWKATFFNKCYGNRAVPQSQHSLCYFRSKIRNTVNIFVGKWSVLNANIPVRSGGRRSQSRAPVSLPCGSDVVLSQVCVPLVSHSHLWLGAVKSSLLGPLLDAFLVCSWMHPAQDSWFLDLENIFPLFFLSKSYLLKMVRIHSQ